MNNPPYMKYLNDPDFRQEDLALCKKLRCETVVNSEHGESATQFFIFEGDTSNEEIEACLMMLGYGVDETFCKHEYDCCGHWYRTKVRIMDYVPGTEWKIAFRGLYQNV